MIAAVRVGQFGVWEQLRECPDGSHDYRHTHSDNEFRHFVCRRCCQPRRVDLDTDLDR